MRRVYVLLLALWPPTTWAAVTLMNTLEDLTWGIVGVLFFISTLAGLASLAVRLDREVRTTGRPIVAPLLFAAVNMLGAWTAAAFAFFIAEGTDLGDWTELGVILLSSFGGARVLEKAVVSYLDKYLGTTAPAVTSKKDNTNEPTTL